MSAPDESDPNLVTIEEHVSAVKTLRLDYGGDPTILQDARTIARSKMGMREDVDDEGNGLNTGEIVDWSCEGMTRRTGVFWCAFFACQPVRRAILLRPPAVAAPLLEEWRQIDSGSCIELLGNLEERDLVVRAVPGRAPPDGAYFVFYVEIKKGQPVMKDGKPHLVHVGVVDYVHGPMLVSISGNSTNQAVAENRPSLTDPRLYAYGLLPSWASQ